MTAPTRVMLADPQGDRFPLRSTLLVVACCALVGALGARAWLVDTAIAPSSHRAAEPPKLPSAGPQLEAAPEPTALQPAAPAPAEPAPVAPAPAAAVAEASAKPASSAASAATTADPRPEPPAAHGSAAGSRARARTFEPGVVAYLRCDGAARHDARYPCPRDRALEADVWRVLGDLTKCPGTDPGAGSGELRLAWSKAGAVDVDVRSGPGQHLNAAAVSKCVGDRLRALRSSVRADRAIAAFHFELR